jgi:hypothetical protein
MTHYTKRPAWGKIAHGRIDDVTDAERAVTIIATRYRLPVNVARLLCEHAGIGASEDRAPASGGKTA